MSVFDSDYFQSFGHSRSLPRPIVDYYVWLLLASSEAKPRRYLDVGAGTGQFATKVLEQEVQVSQLTLLEPAGVAASNLEQLIPSANVYSGTFEAYEASGPSVHDAILLSEVIHLLDNDLHRTVERLRNVTAPGGRALVRTSTHAQLLARSWYRFFPEARELDMIRHPNMDRLEFLANRLGATTRRVTVDESRWVDASDYLNWFQSRSFSTLRAIGQRDYDEGLEALRNWIGGKPRIWHDYAMTALIIDFD